MRIFCLCATVIIASFSFAQTQPLDKVYIVEGMVADRETLKIIPNTFIYNDSLGITTTSDKRGYFKIVVPYELIKKRGSIGLTVIKTGYQRNGSGIMYNPDTVHTKLTEGVVWNYDVPIYLMSKNESTQSSTMSGNVPAEDGKHGYPAIKKTFERSVASELVGRKIEQLKKGNKKVYFLVNGKVALAASDDGYYYFDESMPIIYINEKQVKLEDINKRLKRNRVSIDRKKSDTLSKKLKKDVIVFIPSEDLNKQD